MQVPGTLVVAGDFNAAVTLNVSRLRLADLGVPALTPAALAGPEGQAALAAALTADVRAQPGLFNFDVVSGGFRAGADGRAYHDLEFRISTCRGDIIEGVAGRTRCVGPDDSTIPTPVKHVTQTATIADDGYVYVAAGGTYDSKWDSVADEVRAATRSLRFS